MMLAILQLPFFVNGFTFSLHIRSSRGEKTCDKEPRKPSAIGRVTPKNDIRCIRSHDMARYGRSCVERRHSYIVHVVKHMFQTRMTGNIWAWMTDGTLSIILDYFSSRSRWFRGLTQSLAEHFKKLSPINVGKFQKAQSPSFWFRNSRLIKHLQKSPMVSNLKNFEILIFGVYSISDINRKKDNLPPCDG